MKKILCLILVISMIFCFSYTANANTLISGAIGGSVLSYAVSDEIVDFAESEIHAHLNSFLREGLLMGTKYDYALGEAFTVHNATINSYSFCFPVVKSREIIGILEVSRVDNEFISNFSTSFSEEITKLLANNRNKNYILLTDGTYLQAFDGITCKTIYTLYETDVEPEDLSLTISDEFLFPTVSVSYKSILTAKYAIISASDYIVLVNDGPLSYKTLNIAGVPQIGPTCWAATCAAIINYYKGTSLTCLSVAQYIFPNNPQQGGNWTNMQNAYNHWGLSPTQTDGKISFTNVKTNIKLGDPLHLRISGVDGDGNTLGHSIALIGYEDYSNTTGKKIIFILEPNGGVRKSITLNSSGNFTYALGGVNYSWSKTITF
ncbi:MAG: papain-like cysteine protease family protein [Acutalibacteraceae bacterium]|nr:papain-like cysteine protease family protein [Acutalibacteraceae bacterium]